MAKKTWLTPIAKGDAARFHLTTARGALVATHLEPAFDSASRRKGLLGRDALEQGAAMLIAPCPSVHTFFMRFPIDVIFANREGRVLKVCPHLKRSRLAMAWGAFAAIEIPAGAAGAAGVIAGDQLVLTPAR